MLSVVDIMRVNPLESAFIRHRVTTDSKKFKIFMWINVLGMGSYIDFIASLMFLKLAGYMP